MAKVSKSKSPTASASKATAKSGKKRGATNAPTAKRVKPKPVGNPEQSTPYEQREPHSLNSRET